MRSFYGKTGIEIKDDLTGNLPGLKALIRAAALSSTEKGAKIIAEDAARRCIRSAGVVGNGLDGSHLQDKISYEVHETPEGAYARIGPDMINNWYAPHVEFGLAPFLRPAIDENRDEVHAAMREEMQKFLGAGAAATSTAVRFRRYA